MRNKRLRLYAAIIAGIAAIAAIIALTGSMAFHNPCYAAITLRDKSVVYETEKAWYNGETVTIILKGGTKIQTASVNAVLIYADELSDFKPLFYGGNATLDKTE